jgi:DNA transformation protein and related proteins
LISSPALCKTAAAMNDEFTQHCLELLAPLGAPRARRMFGGRGLYVDDLFIALILAERLYLKVDAQTRARFEAAGCLPFTYEAKGKRVSLGYFTAPDALGAPGARSRTARQGRKAGFGPREDEGDATRQGCETAQATRQNLSRRMPLDRPPLHARCLVTLPGFDHRALGPADLHARTAFEHMVVEVAVAGQPDAAVEHRQLAGAVADEGRLAGGQTHRGG